MRGLARTLRRVEASLLVFGDRKGPQEYGLKGTELFTLERQRSLPLALPKLLPINHYSRKNVGYLVAISRGAACIYETDDDNRPNSEWKPRSRMIRANVINGPRWCNVYRRFTDKLIWPRGFPLQEIQTSGSGKLPRSGRLTEIASPIQQGLVDSSPDVDAVWRLVLDVPIHFNPADSVALQPGVWCPFNSQSTWWWPDAYPLMYLPSFCSFRMTDIWRSFVAQRCLWEMGGRLSFHTSEVVQLRNPHNLMRDFADEIPGYARNDELVKVLEEQPLERGLDAVLTNLVHCYETLVRRGFFPTKEMKLIRAWIKDLDGIKRGRRL
jgi:hypothetical protein